MSQGLAKDPCIPTDPSWPQLAAPPEPALTSSAPEQACRQRLQRGFQQPALELGFHTDGQKTSSSSFYTTTRLGPHCPQEVLQVLRAGIIRGSLLSEMFLAICRVSPLKTLLVPSCIWQRFPAGWGGLGRGFAAALSFL